MKKTRKIIIIAMILALLTAVFTLPASAVLLGKDGFYYEFDENGNAALAEYHSSNTEVVIPSEVYDHPVISIKNYTFLRNTEITSVTVPDSVTQIGNSAFYGCTNLETIMIPSSVTELGNSVFANCENLTIICCPGSAAEEYAQNNNISYMNVCYGDINFDGKITSADSLTILRNSVGLENLTDLQNSLCNVDSDERITSADALYVLRYSVSLPVDARVGEFIATN